jgi:gluconate 5-dehydrogenase
MTTLESLFSLKGQVALVTGASAGLGVEFAKAMAIGGADVALVARRMERLEALAPQIEALGVRCLPVQADLSDPAQLEEAYAQVTAGLGPVDILINNAGIAPAAKAEKHPAEEWEQALRINLTAPFQLAQHAARGMIERGRGGRIINIGSVMGEVASAVFPTAAYNASKGGMHMLTRQLAIEWARHGITVNALAPAWFPSEMAYDPRHGGINPRYQVRMEELTPMKRLGREGELTAALIFLASPAASYVTGSVLTVDGGWLSW